MFRTTIRNLRPLRQVNASRFVSTQAKAIPRANLARHALFVTAVGASLASVYALYPNQLIALEAPAATQTSSATEIQPPTKTPPFPVKIAADGTTYTLLGCGVRRVSFLGFDVYAIGLYIPESQKKDIRELLQSTAGFQQANGDVEEFKKSLLDPVNGAGKIRWLLDQGINIRIRIVPVRNTDFGHLRDGFVRTILAHPEAKEASNNKEFADGLAELKTTFSRKMSVPKHNVLIMNRDANNGSLKVTYYAGQDETKVAGDVLGTVNSPQVSELLLLQYLTGQKPISETLQAAVIDGLVNCTIE